MSKTDISFQDLKKCGHCQDCEHSFEDESVDGNWHLYCIKKIGCRDGCQVQFWGSCGDFEEKIYRGGNNADKTPTP